MAGDVPSVRRALANDGAQAGSCVQQDNLRLAPLPGRTERGEQHEAPVTDRLGPFVIRFAGDGRGGELLRLSTPDGNPPKAGGTGAAFVHDAVLRIPTRARHVNDLGT